MFVKTKRRRRSCRYRIDEGATFVWSLVDDTLLQELLKVNAALSMLHELLPLQTQQIIIIVIDCIYFSGRLFTISSTNLFQLYVHKKNWNKKVDIVQKSL